MKWLLVSAAVSILVLEITYLGLVIRQSRNGPKRYWVGWPHRFGKTAITLPPLGIYIDTAAYTARSGESRSRLIAHELTHWAQWERLGFWRGNVGYVLLALRYGIKNHPREIEARAAADTLTVAVEVTDEVQTITTPLPDYSPSGPSEEFPDPRDLTAEYFPDEADDPLDFSTPGPEHSHEVDDDGDQGT